MSHPSPNDRLFNREEGRRARDSGLPPDVLAQAARRLRILALLYAFIFFMSAFLPTLLSAQARSTFFSSFSQWGPGSISIAVALVVALLTRNPNIPIATVMNIGLAFEIVSSYGIAAAEFLDPTGIDFNAGRVGLSWVAVWVLLFTVVVPNSPRRTVLATLASVSSVPVVLALIVAAYHIPGATPAKFFLGLIFPYLLVTLMAYVGARVIYALGKEVARARELGGYRLVERLGAGGMGEVWRAEHRLLTRPAAIKLIRPDADDAPGSRRQEEMRARFSREAQATASMRSPHTIEVYDFGTAGDGTFYYVMELLEGFTMEALVERFGPLPAERAIYLMTQVCRSLGEAHEEGLIHRDVKPANVFVCRYGRQVDFVKVLDFGMVKSSRESMEMQLTGEQAVLGTPAFMAPEQVLGNRAIDARADLYAVGCLAYWLLTGQLVFTGGTAMELMLQHAHVAPDPPSMRSELAIPPALDALVLACLAKDPDGRPASAEELAEALASIPGAPSWTTQAARDWWDQHQPRKSPVAK